ncbi:hypothetical protein K2173_013942 [Erythroxylum novogranatense]|uniref:Uncharacterized protein n=1 Tax=Erythroxylum novogranatense TaxID=1862640 RepID=A0AAV8SCV3_9ROSI|nr:hypothetical protein K2173_013942 [Erythroxylum novogranatense]
MDEKMNTVEKKVDKVVGDMASLFECMRQIQESLGQRRARTQSGLAEYGGGEMGNKITDPLLNTFISPLPSMMLGSPNRPLEEIGRRHLPPHPSRGMEVEKWVIKFTDPRYKYLHFSFTKHDAGSPNDPWRKSVGATSHHTHQGEPYPNRMFEGGSHNRRTLLIHLSVGGEEIQRKKAGLLLPIDANLDKTQITVISNSIYY